MNNETEMIPEKDYLPPKIIEKKKIEIELFSDEPDPWGPC